MSRKIHQRKRTWIVLAAAALAVAGMVYRPEIAQACGRIHWADIDRAVRTAGPWAPLWCILLDAAFTVLSLPTTLVGILVALLFGVVRGLAICLAGLGLGMAATFLIARYLARDWLARRIGHTRLYRRLEANMQQDGWKLVAFTRLLPINPFSVLNYAYGLTSIPFWQYWIASVIGIIPNVLALLWTTRAAGQLARGQLDWKVLIILFSGAGLFAVLAWLPRLLRRRLPAAIPAPGDGNAEDDGD